MADGTPDRSTGTCQGQALEHGDIQLSLRTTLGPRRSSENDWSRFPPNARELLASLAITQRSNRPEPYITEHTLSEPQRSKIRDGENVSVLGKNEVIAMVESPAGSSQRPPSREAKTPTRPRGVTYASSAAGSSNREKRPPRQDSAYFSTRGMEDNNSEVDFDIKARQLRARERIIIRRERVRKTRRLLKSCRGKVQRLRDDVQDAVNKLTRKINEQRALNLDLRDTIDPLYERFRLAQDQLGPAEDEYDTLERRLDEEEDAFDEEEDDFYSHYDLFKISVPEAKINATLSPLAEPSQPADSEPTDIKLDNSLLREYLDKMEEAERLKEDVEELENEYLQATDNATFRRRHNIPLSEEMSNFLVDYPKLHAEALADLHDAEDALFDTRDKCIEQGVFTESEYAYEPRDAFCDDIMDYVFDACNRSPIRTAAHNLHYDDRSADFGDKKDYVNKWLLQWVEDSTVGTLLLRAFIYFEFPNDTDELDDEKWSKLAVENWDQDRAGVAANKNNRESRLDTIAGVDPGAAGKKHATSTARSRSGISSSLRTMDAVADDEAMMGQILTMSDSAASYSTQQPTPTTPKRRRASSTNTNSPHDSTPLVPSSAQRIDANQFQFVIEAAPPVQTMNTLAKDNISASFQSVNSIATSGAFLSSHTSFTDTATTSTENDARAEAPVRSDNQDSSYKIENDSPQRSKDSAGLVKELPPSVENLETPSLVVQLSEATFTIQGEVQDETASTPKARPVVDDNAENLDMAALVLNEPAITPTLVTDIADEPTPSTLADSISLEDQDSSTSNTSLKRPTPDLDTPTFEVSLRPRDQLIHHKAKSEDILPTLRTSSDPIRSPRTTDTLSPDTHKIRHRRSLSPTSMSFISAASHTIRKISSFGTFQPP